MRLSPLPLQRSKTQTNKLNKDKSMDTKTIMAMIDAEIKKMEQAEIVVVPEPIEDGADDSPDAAEGDDDDDGLYS